MAGTITKDTDQHQDDVTDVKKSEGDHHLSLKVHGELNACMTGDVEKVLHQHDEHKEEDEKSPSLPVETRLALSPSDDEVSGMAML